MDVLVAGGAGFVGLPLCRVLLERGHDVTAASRSPDSTALPSGVQTTRADVTDADLTALIAGHDVVVNLVALPSHVQSARSHESVHLVGTRNLVQGSEAAGVERFVQLSGLGVTTGVATDYFRAKRAAELVVRDADLEWVVYRPSVVFGAGCAFLPFIESLTAWRVLPLPGGGGTRIQPIWVEDLVPLLADGVDDEERAGACYELGGPEPITLADVVRAVRTDVIVVPVPRRIASVGFAVADLLPHVPIGRDQYRALDLDNTVEDNDVTAFGVSASSLRTLGDYLEGRP